MDTHTRVMTTTESGLARALTWGAWGLLMTGVVVVWLFPEAPARLQRAWQPTAWMEDGCDLRQSACTARFADGVEITLAVDPPHAPAVTPLSFQVDVHGPLVPTHIKLLSLDMWMGEVSIPLSPASDAQGRWYGETTLPVCTADRMQWRAHVAVGDRLALFDLWSTRG